MGRITEQAVHASCTTCGGEAGPGAGANEGGALRARLARGIRRAYERVSARRSMRERRMFFPLRDDNPAARTPWVTYALIAGNVTVFVLTSSAQAAGQFWLTAWYGLVPTRLLADPSGEAITLWSSMFMHGGLMHLVSNMWFLHIFGDNLEDALGKVRYLLFYLACGLFAALLQVATDLRGTIPMVGASGAIAGVVGGYVLLFPRAPILALNTVPLLWLFMGILLEVPAWLIAFVFFGQNVLMAYQQLGGAGSVGVAIFAHIGGFLAGLVLIKPLFGGRPVPRRVWRGWQASRRPRPRHRR